MLPNTRLRTFVVPLLALAVAGCNAATATPTGSAVVNGATASGSAGSASAAGSASTSGGASASGASVSSSASGGVSSLVFNTNYNPQKGQSGGTLIFGEWQPASQLNEFYTAAETDVEAILPIMRGFATITSDGKYIPDLATSIPTPDNGGIKINGSKMDMTLTLKPNLKWSDGQPLTMNDFKYTWQWANDSAQNGCVLCGPGSAYPLISSVDVSADGRTATLHFSSLFGGWLNFLTNPILPQHYMSKIAIADAPKKSYPAGPAVIGAPVSGPFVIKNITSTEIDYDRNPNWNAGVSPSHQGAAYLDHLKIQYFGDKAGEISAFKSGAVDLAWDLFQDSYPTLKSTPSSVGSAQQDVGWEYEHFDLNNDPSGKRGNGMNDPNVRKAIAMAVNKTDIINAVFPGSNLTPACSPTPPGIWYHKDETCPSFDPSGARQLLTQAGWTKDSAGFVAKNGKEMDLELCTTSGNPTRLTELQKLAGQLQAIGIKSHIKTADASSVVFASWADTTPSTDCSIYRGTYDIADFAFVLTGTPYTDYYFVYRSDKWPELGDHSGSNDTRFKSPEMDQALQNLTTDVTFEKQLTDAQAVQDAYVAGIPEVPLYYRNLAAGVSAHFGNWAGIAKASIGPTWNVEDWYSKP